MKTTDYSHPYYQTAEGLDVIRRDAMVDGSYAARKAEIDEACSAAWRKRARGARPALTEAQALGFTALD